MQRRGAEGGVGGCWGEDRTIAEAIVMVEAVKINNFGFYTNKRLTKKSPTVRPSQREFVMA